MNKEHKNEMEKIRKANQDTINTSHNMVELIQQYLHTDNEDEKKKIFSEIIAPRPNANNPEKNERRS
jgi:hypothetical protein